MSAIRFRIDANSPWQELPMLQGEKGDKGDKGDQGPQGIQGPAGADSTVPGPAGPKGDKGDTYTITAADYDAIANVVLTKIPSSEGVGY